jgi:hypothetical protein
MTGWRRLSVMITVVWVGFWFIAYTMDGTFNWAGFVLFGIAPVSILIGLPWAVRWVWLGFREGK